MFNNLCTHAVLTVCLHLSHLLSPSVSFHTPASAFIPFVSLCCAQPWPARKTRPAGDLLRAVYSDPLYKLLPGSPPSPAQAFILLCRPTPVSHVDLTDRLLQCGSSPAKQAQPNKGLFTAESTCQQEGRGRKPAPSLRQGSSQLSTSLLSWSTPVISDSTIGCRMFIISNQQ